MLRLNALLSVSPNIQVVNMAQHYLNENKNLIDESFFLCDSFFFGPEGLYFWNPIKTSAYDNSYVFTLVDLKPTSNDATTLHKDIKKRLNTSNETGGVDQYLTRQQKINAENEAVVLAPLDKSCGSCLDFVLKYFSDGVLTKGTGQPRLILLASNPTEVQKAFVEHHLEAFQEHIIVDDKNLYLKYTESWHNPRWVAYRDGKIVEDLVLNPTEVYSLPNMVKKYVKGD